MGHEITVLGINHHGEPYDQTEFPYMIYPAGFTQEQEHVFGLHKLWAIQDKLHADVMFFLNDPWVIDMYMNALKDMTNGGHPGFPYTKMVGYFPTDAGPLKKKWADTLNKLDAQVCYSKYAEQVITSSNGGKRPKNLHQIYHGVDTKVYQPMSQQQVRQQLGLKPTDFIVGMVARNQIRKRFDILMKAFADFSKDKEDVKLYLHTAVKDIGFDIADLSEQFGLGKNLILTDNIEPGHGVPEEFLNVIYNSFSVNCLISLGDGFGLPVAESMATGCPQLVSGHSCLRELVEGHGGLTVKTAAWILTDKGINTWGGVSDVADLTAKLQLLYEQPQLRMHLAQQGYEYIKQDKFNWDFVAKQFDSIFKNLFHIMVKEERNGVTTLNRPASISSEIPMESAGSI